MRRDRWLLAGLGGIALFAAGVWVGSWRSQAGAPVGITTGQADAMLEEFKQIRAALERPPAQDVVRAAPPAAPAPPPVRNVQVSIADSYAMGSEQASLTLVEFADYQCPFCAQFHTGAFAQLKQDYIDAGKLRFVSRDLPLPFHQQAEQAAQAARCAGDQGAYWEMRHLLLTNSASLSDEAYGTFAKELSLNVKRFQRCLDEHTHQEAVRADAAAAGAAGLTGTPSFVLGKASGDTVDGVTLIGAQPYQAFETSINDLLAGKAPSPPQGGGGPTAYETIKEVDLSGLPEPQRAQVLRTANTERCPCGCQMTLAQCLNTDATCPIRSNHLARVRQLVAEAGAL